MDSLWINFGFSIVIGLLQTLGLSPATKAKYEKAFLKVFSLIWSAFASDERFRKVVGLPAEEVL